MTYGPVSQCHVCARVEFTRGPTCAAFPAGIPTDVLDNTRDHRSPVEGDNGVRWQSDGRPHPSEAESAGTSY